MFTGTLAMLHRALRLDARLLRTHLFRLGFAGLVYLSLAYAVVSSGMVGAPGLQLFETMTYLNLVLISLAGVSFFATAITEEKEEETLGLLMLAGINPIGILLGKSTSRLVGTVLLLLVQLPFTLLAITLGGVTLGQVLAAYVSLVSYLLLAANMGVICSVVSRRGGTASGLTLLLIVVYLGSSHLVSLIQTGLLNGGGISPRGAADNYLSRLANWCREASILDRLKEIMQTGFADQALGFQAQVSIAGALVLLGLAWLGFHRFTRNAPDARSPRADLMARFVGLGRRRRTRPGRYALAWKEFHFVTGGMQMQVAKFFGYGAVVGCTFWAAERYYSYSFAQSGQFVAWGMLGAMTFEASLYASRVFHDEWRGRTLPLLAMVPGQPATIITSKIVGCAPALAPALFWLVAGCLIWPSGLEEFSKSLILPSRWFYGLLLVLFMTLTAFFSMIVRWGALPLAAAVMAVGMAFSGCCGSPVFMMISRPGGDSGSAELGFALVDAVILTLILGLQFDVRRRVEIASAQ
jgi:ABC-type transport system involved in multi-copper enzyme maturation permease subunit